MKTIICFLLFALACVTPALTETKVVFADPPLMNDKEFCALLKNLQKSEPMTSSRAKDVRNAVSRAISEITNEGSLSEKTRNHLSVSVIGHYRVLKELKYEKEPVGHTLYNVCIVLNRKIAGKVDSKIVSRRELSSFRDLARDIRLHLFKQELFSFSDLDEAATFADIALREDEPELLLSTYDIHLIWRAGHFLEGAGWYGHAASFHVAAAKATKKLTFLEDKEYKVFQDLSKK